MKFESTIVTLLIIFSSTSIRCQEEAKPNPPEDELSHFYFGADLSYVNQILDKGGVYKDENEIRSPYQIFSDHGANLVRLRLWHNPTWTIEIYEPSGTQLYNDLQDVEKAIALSKLEGMEVFLDFHYSDNWADPGKQEVPEAWKNIIDLATLKDSVYQYTFKTLSYLKSKDLMPELVQIGNETNCGMLYTNAPSGFPSCNICNDGQWARLGEVINSAIKAIRDVDAETKVLLHVADPKNVEWWFDNVTGTGKVTDFDMIGFSYYPLWHRTVSLDALSASVSTFKNKYDKPVMILETAYPWTTEHDDNYNNHFGGETPIEGYPFTKEGQENLLKKITQEVIDGGGVGVVYWEPAWISTTALKDQWGEGSAWENNTLFDFDGNVIPSINYMKHEYERK